jgi:CRP-like cAMP-binding protein
VAVKGGQQVFKYEGSGSFGELALMYNCPRAATVQVGAFSDVLQHMELQTFSSGF